MRTIRPLAVALVVIALFTATAASAATQLEFRVIEVACPGLPSFEPSTGRGIPPECTPAGGVSFTIRDTTGTILATCTTDERGICLVTLPEGITVVMTEDVSTAPPGTVPLRNPFTTQVLTEFAGAGFVNLPRSTGPSTGRPRQGPGGIALVVAALGGGLALAGWSLRQAQRGSNAFTAQDKRLSSAEDVAEARRPRERPRPDRSAVEAVQNRSAHR